MSLSRSRWSMLLALLPGVTSCHAAYPVFDAEPQVLSDLFPTQRPKLQPGATLSAADTEALLDPLQLQKEDVYFFEHRGKKVILPVDRFRDSVSSKELDKVDARIWINQRELKTWFGEEGQEGILEIVDGGVSSLTLLERSLALDGKYRAPGWFDVGVGFGQVFNVYNTRSDGKPRNNDALGTFISARAYPFGRWYTEGLVNKPGGGEEVALGVTQNYRWFQRLSAVYGVNIDGTLNDDNAIDGGAHVFGIGFDFAPEYSVVAGISFFHLNEGFQGGGDNRAFFLGVSLNLNAFRALMSSSSAFVPSGQRP